jgi:hypothetical protein
MVLNMLAEATTTEISKEKNQNHLTIINKLHVWVEQLQAIRDGRLKKRPEREL